MTQGARGLSEVEIIQRFFQRPGAAGPDLVLGIGDDAALLKVPAGQELVVSVDTIVAGRHFLEQADARAVGHRALAVNLSDMAAMGAEPKWATLSLTLPVADERWLHDFAAAFLALADDHGVHLIGGDTTQGPLTVGVQIMGLVPAGAALRRDGGRAGDLLAVSGTLGDAGAGLELARARSSSAGAAEQALIARFEYPTPRVALGRAARGLASGAMDISDGLAADLPKFARASGLAARVEVERLPISAALAALATGAAARDLALGAGDDYELLFSVPRAKFEALAAAARRLNLTLSIIGELQDGAGVQWMLNGAKFAPRVAGFDHFDRPSTQITV